MTKRIFTFWEPKEKIPAYLKLCIKTWQKNLPAYEIVMLDYSELEKWLGKNYYDKFLYSKVFSLPKQADAIRCAILKNYGGIWFDLDTIVFSSKAAEIFNKNSKFIIVDKHLGLLSAQKDSSILQNWEKDVRISINNHKFFCRNQFTYILTCIFAPKIAKKLKRWNCLGNAIVDKYLDINNPQKALILNKKELCILPELNWAEENNIDLYNNNEHIKNYTKFYYEENHIDYILKNNTCGLIELHNSRALDNYKNLSEKDFLNMNNTISNLIKIALNEDL